MSVTPLNRYLNTRVHVVYNTGYSRPLEKVHYNAYYNKMNEFLFVF